MARTVALLILAALFLAACGNGGTGLKDGMKAAAAVKPAESAETQKIVAGLEKVQAQAKQVIKKEEVPKPPVEVEYYLLTEAYEESGFRPEALRRKVAADKIKGLPYARMTRYNGLAERTELYDEMGNQTYVVSYLWDKQFNVWGAVYKTATDRMLAMHLFCPGEKAMFVHEMSTFRVHAAYTRKVTLGETAVIVEYVDGHNAKGELPIWPKCEELKEWQERAAAWQSPWGLSRHVYQFDPEGNILSISHQDLQGQPVEDIQGVARKEFGWKDGRLIDESYSGKSGLLARYNYAYDGEGRLVSKAVVDAGGSPVLDYLGAAKFEFSYDKKGRLAREVRKNLAGEPFETHEYLYGKLNQVETHKVLDAAGKLTTTYQHTFDKRGTRTQYAIYEGEPPEGKLKLDVNGVAMYRFAYNDKGRLLKETRHGIVQVADKDGKQDFILVNGLDGWAVFENAYDEKDGNLTQTITRRVDAAGNVVMEELRDKDGLLVYRLDNTYTDNKLTESVKTLFENEKGTKKQYLDPAGKVLYTAQLQLSPEDAVVEIAFFQADEKTPYVLPDGYQKMTRTFGEDGKLKVESYFDAAGVKVKMKQYEYTPEGALKEVKLLDGAGNPLPVPPAPAK